MIAILAVEPDEQQRELLAPLLERVAPGGVTLVSTRKDAENALARSGADLLLLSAFLLPQDERALVGRLRTMGTSHVQTLVIPRLRRPVRKPATRFSLRRTQPRDEHAGGDPAPFELEVAEYLTRARALRAAPARPDPADVPPPPRAPAPPAPVEPATEDDPWEAAARDVAAPGLEAARPIAEADASAVNVFADTPAVPGTPQAEEAVGTDRPLFPETPVEPTTSPYPRATTPAPDSDAAGAIRDALDRATARLSEEADRIAGEIGDRLRALAATLDEERQAIAAETVTTLLHRVGEEGARIVTDISHACARSDESAAAALEQIARDTCARATSNAERAAVNEAARARRTLDEAVTAAEHRMARALDAVTLERAGGQADYDRAIAVLREAVETHQRQASDLDALRSEWRDLRSTLVRARQESADRDTAGLEALRAEVQDLQAQLAGAAPAPDPAAPSTTPVRPTVVRLVPPEPARDTLGEASVAARPAAAAADGEADGTPGGDYYALWRSAGHGDTMTDTAASTDMPRPRRHRLRRVAAIAAGLLIGTVYRGAFMEPSDLAAATAVEQSAFAGTGSGMAASGRLRVEAAVGTRVLLNGLLLGEAPLSSHGVPEGTHTLTLEREGRTVSRPVHIRRDQTTVIAGAVDVGWLATSISDAPPLAGPAAP
ncbi:MAG: PEGA domain-containing protein [Acidimicrobiia bacterium]|nr:PEGA domain-containing protein [Acidimicrobiia bacterium]